MQFIAKTVEEATEKAICELGVEKEKLQIQVIETPKKGLFGRMKGQAVIEVSVMPSDADRAVQFVQGILDKMGINAIAELTSDAEKTIITLISTKTSEIIGYRGEVLDAIQTLAGAALNIGKKEYKKVVVDCENYRDRREDALVKLAHKLEEKATSMRREVILEPMNPAERRIIHVELANSQTVTTRSDGKEPNRYVVIVPNDKDEYSKPYNAGRNNSNKSNGKGRKERTGNKRKNGGARKFDKKPSPQVEQKKKKSISFGTYLGNSLKNDD